MSPRSCSGGPKSSPRGPKTAPRAARSAPRGAQEQPGTHQKGPKRGPGRPRSAKRPFGRPPGPILASFWGALGFIFKQLRRPFRSSRALRQTIENTLRNHWSKGLVLAWPAFGGRKRNHDEGFTFFSGQERLLCLRIQLASQTCFLIRRNSKTHGFYVVPCFPSLFWDPPGLPEARNRTKMLFEITRQKLLRDRCGPEAHKDPGSVAGLGALAPLEIRPQSSSGLSIGRRGSCWCVV